MNYSEAISFLFSHLPMYQRIGNAAYKPGLDNTILLCNHLQNPQNKFKSIHIAGTNGKGSTSHYLASILQNTGLKVGLYTSPHLKDFRERIKINGKLIPESYVVDFVNSNKSFFVSPKAGLKLSFFEMTAGLAFKYFADENVDAAIIETGMGGRLDSTNIINPLLSVITNIGLDHTQFLGDTLEKIAFEKAGIIKPHVPVVIGQSHPQTTEIFKTVSHNNNSECYFADKNFHVQNVIQKNDCLQMDIYYNEQLFYECIKTDLIGIYQKHNVVTVLMAIKCLQELNYNITEKDVRNGFQFCKHSTGLSGRWEIINKNPLTICDVGHNKEGICKVLEQIKSVSHNNLHFVFGMVNDKDAGEILNLLPKEAIYYFCKADIPRGLDQNKLESLANETGLRGSSYISVKEALKTAQKNASKDDLVFVGGSTFVVAEVI